MQLSQVASPSPRQIRLAKEVKAQRILARGAEESQSGCLWPAPYSEDTPEAAYRFITECCKTCEDTSLFPLGIPPKDYIRWVVWHWWDTKRLGEPLVFWKSRRLIISWLLRALDVWDTGRRPASVVIGANGYEGKNGSKQFVWRCWFIYNQLRVDFPEWRLPEPYTQGNTDAREIDSLHFKTGSNITAINSAGSSFRGSGASRAECEELNEYQYVAHTWGQAITVCQAPPGETNGHAIAVCNTSPNTEWQEIKSRAKDQPENNWLEAPVGCAAWISNSGARVLDIHYHCDPEKRTTQWRVTTSKGVPIREWMREMEKDESIYDGEPVYRDYDDKVHCPAALIYNDIPIVPGSTYIGGWDCGNTLQPAFVLDQVTPGRPAERQVHTLLEIVAPGEAMETFAPLVFNTLVQMFPTIWDEVYHVGDQTVTTRQGNNKQSAQDVARRHGIYIHPMSNQWAGRVGAVVWLLCSWIDQSDPDPTKWTPRYYVSGKNCPVLHAGFKGGYRLAIAPRGDTSGPGRILTMPLKNDFSHVHDAKQYAAMKIRELIEGVGKKKKAKQQ
jgi:hypothetical protein